MTSTKPLKEFLVGYGLYEKFVNNVPSEKLEKALEDNDLRSFSWIDSPEGWQFWDRMYVKYMRISGWMD